MNILNILEPVFVLKLVIKYRTVLVVVSLVARVVRILSHPLISEAHVPFILPRLASVVGLHPLVEALALLESILVYVVDGTKWNLRQPPGLNVHIVNIAILRLVVGVLGWRHLGLIPVDLVRLPLQLRIVAALGL